MKPFWRVLYMLHLDGIPLVSLAKTFAAFVAVDLLSYVKLVLDCRVQSELGAWRSAIPASMDQTPSVEVA